MLIKDKNGKTINVLTTDEVRELHHLLSNHPQIADITEPISPPGVKSSDLLESAVYRQTVGIGEYTKYDNCYSNCATLVFGIARNHAFHNGNKRTALLCMLKHLFRNGYVLRSSVSNTDIYHFLTLVAAGTLNTYKLKNKRYASLHRAVYGNQVSKVTQDQSDELALKFIEGWVRMNSVSKRDADRPVRWGSLISILRHHKLEVNVNDKDKKIEVIRTKKALYIFQVTAQRKIYPYNGTDCPKHLVRDIRKYFGLTSLDGFDNPSFYDEQTFMDEEIALFKQAIYRLSKS